MQIVKKLINCDRTYAKGVFKPYKVLFKKVLLVKTTLKKSRISWDYDFFLKADEKNIFFRIFKI